MADINSPLSGAEQNDLNLTAIIKALDSGEPMPGISSTADLELNKSFDPNATMDYQRAGVPFPELPFAGEDDVVGRVDKATQTTGMAWSQHGQLDTPGNLDKPVVKKRVRRIPDRPASTARQAPRQAPRQAIKPATNTQTRNTRNPLDASDYDNPGSRYRPVDVRNSTYKIRGGGGFRYRHPVLIAVWAILLIAGIGIAGFGLNNLVVMLSSNTGGVQINLTATQTREALDSHVSVLLTYIDTSIDDTTAIIRDSGQNVYTNDRYRPDSPDASAVGNEMISMPNAMTEEQMQGFYEGSYNAYTPEELTQDFNGSYVLDLARGDMGSWNKLKYVNLKATSIDDEISRISAIQLLSGDGVTVSEQGIDTRGNNVVQGQKVIDGERVLYFKIAACQFNDVYSAHLLDASSVYITCTLATYDFFTGADTITPA